MQWLFSQLWLKTTGPRAPKFSFKIADTVVMDGFAPKAWYFSDEAGYILKKNQNLSNPQEIANEFAKRVDMTDYSMPAATTYMIKPQRNRTTGHERTALCIGHLSRSAILPYLNSAF